MTVLANVLMENNEARVVTYNYLAQATTGFLSLDVAGSADVTLTNPQAAHYLIELTGVLTDHIDILVPQREKPYVFLNSTTGAFIVNVRPVTSGTGRTAHQGFYTHMYCDGVNIERMAPTANRGNLLLTNGTAQPATADAVNLWAADTGGVADKSGLHIMTEDGTAHVLGNFVGIGTLLPIVSLHVAAPDGSQANVAIDSYVTAASGPAINLRHARGTVASPVLLNVSDSTGNFSGTAWARNAGDTDNAFVTMGRLRALVQSKDAQGRMGGYLEFSVSPGVSATVTERLRLTESGTLILGNPPGGTDAVTLIQADILGVAGESGLQIVDETGVTTSIGKGVLSRRIVRPSTAGVGSPNLLTAEQSGATITNEGATALQYNTLPAAVAGLWYTFIAQDADLMRVTAAAGDTIRIGPTVSAAAGFAQAAAQGNTLTLHAINATEWVSIAREGTWNLT